MIDFPLLSINIHNEEFIWTTLSYFLFIIPFSLILLYKTKTYYIKESVFELKYQYKYFLFFVYAIFILYLIYLFTRIYGLERYMIKELTGNILDTLVFATIVYFWIFLIFFLNKRSYMFYIFSLLTILNMLLIFERENIVILLMIIFYKYFNKLKLKYFIITLVFGILIISYTKSIVAAFQFAENIDQFISIIKNNDFLFSKMDSLVSFLMIGDYFKGNATFYDNLPVTYITHSIVHFFKVFLSLDFPTLAQQSTLFYTNNSMGTAFSLILESILNFNILGPTLIGIILALLFRYIYLKLIPTYGYTINILMIIVSLKLIRTEFSIVLKLYILPMIISYIIFKLFFKKVKVYEK